MADPLEKFRVDGEEPEERPEPEETFERLTAPSFRRILAFDQSLANTGAAWVTGDSQGFNVIDTFMVRTSPEGKGGYEDSFRRGIDVVYPEVQALMDRVQPHIVVHEMPAVNPRFSQNSEGTIIVCTVIRIAARHRNAPVVMVNNQHMKKVLTGSAKVEKHDVRDAVKRHIPDCGAAMSYANDDTFDAVALAIVAGREWNRPEC